MGKGKEKEHRPHRRDRPRGSDNPLQRFAQQALQIGGHSSSLGPPEAQQYSSTPAAGDYVIQQPRPAPYQQGQFQGDTSSGGGYSGNAQYSGGLASDKRARESSSSSGDQQREHERRHHKHGEGTHKHKKHHHGGHDSSRRDEFESGGRSHQDPRHHPGIQGANIPPAAPPSQPGPWQNTSWSTNTPATVGYGSGGGSGGDVRVRGERQSGPSAGFPQMPAFPPAGPGPMPTERPQLAPMPWLPPRPGQWREEQGLGLPPVIAEPPNLAPFETEPQPRVLPPLQVESRQRRPMLPSVPTGMGTEPAAPQPNTNPDPDFTVPWQGQTFGVSIARATRGWTPTQVREARVLVASFATWDEASEFGQAYPGGRVALTVAQFLKRDDGSRWGLQRWHEWTREEDVTLWNNCTPPPTETLRDVATRIQRVFPRKFHGRLIDELVGRLMLMARSAQQGLHPDQMGRTTGGFPHFGFAEKNRERQNR